MKEEYMCYCGLYCENCAVKAKIEPAATVLHEEMKKAGFEEIIRFIPGGDGFWPFLKSMAETGLCVSCKAGSGDPDCAIRACAQKKGEQMCAFCESYPCERFAAFFESYPSLKDDNALLRDEGTQKWSKLQENRKVAGFTYGS